MGSEPAPHIRELDHGAAPVVAGIIAVCGEHIHRTAGLDHWYPLTRLDPLVDRLGGSDLFGVFVGELLAAVFTLSLEPLPYY
jgi:hypothetical protein